MSRRETPSGRFGELETSLLETFAGLASLAVRNAASFEQSVRQARVQRGFYGIASALAEHLSHAATLDAVAHAANEALGGSFAAVLMPGARGLELAASYRLPDELAASLAEGVPESARPLLETAARERRMLSASSLDDDERFGEDWRRLAGVRSLLAIPVDPPRREEGGLVVVFFVEQRTFTDDDLELGRRLAGAARGGLERSELYESERTSRALVAAARAHGQPARDRARSGGDPRRRSPSRRRRCSAPTRARSRSSRATSSS